MQLKSLIPVAALLAASVHAQAPQVRVLVHGVHEKGQVVYRYQVQNDSASAIDYLLLGQPEAGKALPATPWKTNALLTDVPSPVPVEQCVAFKSMTCEVALHQFTNFTEPRAVLTMRGAELQALADNVFRTPELIKAGMRSSVAVIRAPVRSPGYLDAPAFVGLFDRQPLDGNGRPVRELAVKLTRTDTLPPTLTGSLVADRQGAVYEVRVSLQAKDDVDPEPAVEFVSVTANQPVQARDVVTAAGDIHRLQLRAVKGRVYSIAYRAVDGSENVAPLVLQVAAEPR